MSAQLELISRMAAAESRLERLESREQRRLITDYDWLRGWKDDFLGDWIADQYTITDVAGAGSTIGLLDGVHAGVVEIQAGAAAGRYARLWLGNNLASPNSLKTLDADEGWVQLVFGWLMSTSNQNWRFGAADETLASDVILVGHDTSSSPNWIIVTRLGGGAWNTVASAVAADANPHEHAVEVYPITGGRQVDHWLDGVLINSTTTEVPSAVITPINYMLSLGAAARQFICDYWGVIPRNLA